MTKLASFVSRPGHFIGMHFFNPVPADEAGRGGQGLAHHRATRWRASASFAEALGKLPIEVKDAPGFVVNRVLFPMINEAAFALGEGVADATRHRRVHEGRLQPPDGAARARRPGRARRRVRDPREPVPRVRQPALRALPRDQEAGRGGLAGPQDAAAASTTTGSEVPGAGPAVLVYEVGPRDGLQNEPEHVPTASKRELVTRLALAGLRRIEVTSFVSPKWIPQLADADELAATLPVFPGVVYSALVPNERGYERFRAARRRTGGGDLLSASETHNRKNLNCAIDEQLAHIAAGGGARERGRRSRARLRLDGVRLPLRGRGGGRRGGEAGAAALRAGRSPRSRWAIRSASGTRVRCASWWRRWPGRGRSQRLALHLHDTYGRALANVQAGFEAGVRTLRRLARRASAAAPTRRAPRATSRPRTSATCSSGKAIATGVDLDAAGRRLRLARARGARASAPRPRLPGPLGRARARAGGRGRRVKHGGGAARDARTHPRRGRRPGTTRRRAAKASSSAAIAWRCCSTRAPSSRTARSRTALRRRSAGRRRRDRERQRATGRPVCVMANDSTVKAGSWGARTVEKILRIQERAERLRVPLVYLVDSAGARITDQIEMFPGRRGAGRIFHNQVRLSGSCPRSACSSAPRRRAAPTSRPSATSCSWSRATRACTWARRAWPRW